MVKYGLTLTHVTCNRVLCNCSSIQKIMLVLLNICIYHRRNQNYELKLCWQHKQEHVFIHINAHAFTQAYVRHMQLDKPSDTFHCLLKFNSMTITKRSGSPLPFALTSHNQFVTPRMLLSELVTDSFIWYCQNTKTIAIKKANVDPFYEWFYTTALLQSERANTNWKTNVRLPSPQQREKSNLYTSMTRQTET